MSKTIKVTKKLYNGLPETAENDLFKYHFISPDILLYKKTNEYIHCRDLNGELLELARAFHHEMSLVIKLAEEAYKNKEKEKREIEYAKSSYGNPCGLNIKEYKEKAKKWDDIMNEGEDGYNPYIDL